MRDATYETRKKMTNMNVSNSSVGLATIDPTGLAWSIGILLTIGIILLTIGIIVMLIITIKNIQRFFIGTGLAIPVGLVVWYSSWVSGKAAYSNDYNPAITTVIILFSVPALISLGWWAEKTSYFGLKKPDRRKQK